MKQKLGLQVCMENDMSKGPFLFKHTNEIRYPGEGGDVYYLMQHHIRVRDHIMWIRAQVALNTCVSLQHRGLLFAFSANFASAPNIISQIMLAHYLHHPTRPGLPHKGFRFQHDEVERLKRSNPDVFILPFDDKHKS